MDVVPDKARRILDAAARLIVRNGLQCSMAAIAEEAGVATGSLYNYFRSKEDLVLGVYTKVSAEMAAALSLTDMPGLAEDARVRLYIERYMQFIWEDTERARLFDYLDNNPLISMEDAKSVFGPLVQDGIDMLVAAQAVGVVRSGTPTLIMSFVRGSIRNALKRLRQTGKTLSAADRQLVAHMCWDAIQA